MSPDLPFGRQPELRPASIEGRKRQGQAVGTCYRSSRETATRESPARQCRETEVEQTRVPEGRHTSCDTDSGGTTRFSRILFRGWTRNRLSPQPANTAILRPTLPA